MVNEDYLREFGRLFNMYEDVVMIEVFFCIFDFVIIKVCDVDLV